MEEAKSDKLTKKNRRQRKKDSGRKRRGKKDVILDMTKRKIKNPNTNTVTYRDVNLVVPSKAKKNGKLALTTSFKDYKGNLTLPAQIAQREFESTGQFFRRLDRLVSKAKVEASMESRFDLNLAKNPEKKHEDKHAMEKKIDKLVKKREKSEIREKKRREIRKKIGRHRHKSHKMNS